MKHPHPLLALLLLLAMLPAAVGGSLTHLCACEGLMYIAGCSCIRPGNQTGQDMPTRGEKAAAALDSCHSSCTSLSRPDTARQAPQHTPGREEPAPHHCDYVAYAMSLTPLQAHLLPACPTALLHEARLPLPVWEWGLQAPSEPASPSRSILPCNQPHPLRL